MLSSAAASVFAILAAAQDFTNIKVERIAAGLHYAEGPAWSPDGFLTFSDTVTNKLHKFIPGKGEAGSPRSGGSGCRRCSTWSSSEASRCLELIGRGLGTREIAEILHISIKTVESYRARLKEKMNLRSGVELTRFAVQWATDGRKRDTDSGH